MGWTWDPDKNAYNIRVHGIAFKDIIPILEDPLSMSEPDDSSYEFRIKTTGVMNYAVIVVIHTPRQDEHNPNPQLGRIISARKANSRERERYENDR